MGFKKKLLSVILAATMVATGCVTAFANQQSEKVTRELRVRTASEFGYAMGLIRTLQQQGEKVHIYLEADINMDDVVAVDYATLEGGVFDGQGHTISNLRRTLFERLTDSKFKNVDFSNARTKHGAVVEVARKSTIEHVKVLSGDQQYDDNVGGLIGVAVDSRVKYCINHSRVHDEDSKRFGFKSNVGGIVGKSIKSDIEWCDNYGDIKYIENENCGGIVGLGENSNINCCYNQGTVYSKLANPKTGGIVGLGFHSKVHDCLNTGYVNNDGSHLASSYIGGIMGRLIGKAEHQVKRCINISRLGNRSTPIAFMNHGDVDTDGKCFCVSIDRKDTESEVKVYPQSEKHLIKGYADALWGNREWTEQQLLVHIDQANA